MLGGKYRFHGYNSLRAVYQRGQNVRGSMMSLRHSRRGGDRPLRVAVVVSRKVSKSAVVRNRIQRRVYEIVRQQAASITPGSDLLFTVYSEQVATVEAAKLQAAVTELLQKAGVLPTK